MEPKSKTLQSLDFFTMQIGPKEAKYLLSKNTKNRRVSWKHVEKLAKEMASGKWVNNGETIKFSSDDVLLDGQHRLYAVIQSGVTVTMSIVQGVYDPDAFKTIDVNARARGAHQVAEMMGVKNANNVTSVARRLIHWENTSDKQRFSFNTDAWRKITTTDVIDYAEQNEKEIQEMHMAIAKSLAHRRCGAGSALTTALILCNRANKFAAMQFIEGIKTGANLDEYSPVALLRDRLIAPPERRGQKWELELMALTIKAFNKFLHGKSLKTLRWIQGADHPEKFPVPGDR